MNKTDSAKRCGKTAFTLIELMVYTLLFSTFSLIAYGFCTTVYTFLSQHCYHSATVIKNSLGIDMIRKDLMSASKEPLWWDRQKGVFCKEQLDSFGNGVKTCVGWEVIMNKNRRPLLRRSEGSYNFSGHKWTQRSVSNFDGGLNVLALNPVLSQDQLSVIRVGIMYQVGDMKYEEYITIRNRVVL